MRGFEQIVKAAQLAALAHAGQMRKGLDEPFILHPMRVAVLAEGCGLSSEAIAAAYLHDVPEDTTLTLDDLIKVGFHGQTIALVSLLTKWWSDEFVLTPEGLKETLRPSEVQRRIKEEFKPAYYAKIAAEHDAVLLKLLDRTDNLIDMVKALPNERAWAERYLKKTREEISPLTAVAIPGGRSAAVHQLVLGHYQNALWALDKALTVQSMAESIRPLAEQGEGP